MLVMLDGREVFERNFPRYYAGVYPMTDSPGPFNYHDPNWHPFYHGTSLHTQQSVTQSVTSILYGIAIDRGDGQQSTSESSNIFRPRRRCSQTRGTGTSRSATC